jgi:hypothetical protein
MIDLNTLLTPAEIRELDLQRAISCLMAQERGRLGAHRGDDILSHLARLFSKSRGYNPVSELRRLGHPEAAIKELLRRAGLDESAYDPQLPS